MIGVTDDSGQLLQERRYDMFGKEVAVFGSLSVPEYSTGFAGGKDEREFGLVRMGVRFYDPSIARFLSPDARSTFADSQGVNRYSYARNNPGLLIDPSGYEGEAAAEGENGDSAKGDTESADARAETTEIKFDARAFEAQGNSPPPGTNWIDSRSLREVLELESSGVPMNERDTADDGLPYPGQAAYQKVMDMAASVAQQFNKFRANVARALVDGAGGMTDPSFNAIPQVYKASDFYGAMSVPAFALNDGQEREVSGEQIELSVSPSTSTRMRNIVRMSVHLSAGVAWGALRAVTGPFTAHLSPGINSQAFVFGSGVAQFGVGLMMLEGAAPIIGGGLVSAPVGNVASAGVVAVGGYMAIAGAQAVAQGAVNVGMAMSMSSSEPPGGPATTGDSSATPAKSLPKDVKPVTPEQMYDHLEKYHGIDRHTASERLHNIKHTYGFGGADNVLLERTGNVYHPVTREWLGTITQQ